MSRLIRCSSTTDPPQFGLVAEDVAKVNPNLVVHDAKGDIYSVRYDAVNAMLLNEFLKEHRKVEELKAIVEKQEAVAAQQQEQIEALTTGLQKSERAGRSQQTDAASRRQQSVKEAAFHNRSFNFTAWLLFCSTERQRARASPCLPGLPRSRNPWFLAL
jgi:hypothetical protein